MLEEFVKVNQAWLNDAAEEYLRGCGPADQRAIMEVGSLTGCRDPMAIVKSRARQAQKGKKGGKGKEKGKGKEGKGREHGGKGRDFRDFGKDSRSDLGRSGDWGGKPGRWDDGASWGQSPSSGSWDDGAGWAQSSSSRAPRFRDAEEEARRQASQEDALRHKGEVQAENQQAVDEGRCLYCIGIPPLWTRRRVEDFFGANGTVTHVQLLAARAGVDSRAAFVHFEKAEHHHYYHYY